jgi:hypothetical protein
MALKTSFAFCSPMLYLMFPGPESSKRIVVPSKRNFRGADWEECGSDRRDRRAFQTSEKEDGLKWLSRRRNLLVHSLYLRPIQENEGATDPSGVALFTSEFNHLEASLRKKLAPGTPSEEIDRLNVQLQKAAELYPAVLGLCEYAAYRRERWGKS